jgi:hypothetical protein
MLTSASNAVVAKTASRLAGFHQQKGNRASAEHSRAGAADWNVLTRVESLQML